MTLSANVAAPPRALTLAEVSKTFPGTRALDGVSFAVDTGSFHSLVGGNGSGKSTLIKILAGVYQADPGGMIAVGPHERAAQVVTPGWSQEAGIRFVHQDLGLFDPMSVTETVLGGALPRRYGAINWRAAERAARQVLERLNVPVHPRDLVSDLRPAEATLVAIARGLRDAENAAVNLLVLDEPTARLPHAEVDELLDRLRALAAAGQTILYVSHRLDEVLDNCDTVTVLRDGVHQTTRPISGLTRPELTRLIVGDERGILGKRDSVAADTSLEPLLEVRGLRGGPIHEIDLRVRPGEIVALAGLVGSGRTSLLETVFGVHGRTAGSVRVNGSDLPARQVAAAVAAGLAYVPEDRARHSAFLDLGLDMNLSAARLHPYVRRGFFRHSAELRDAKADVARFSIRSAGPDTPMATLSGGNQQKAVLARWLRRNPRLLLLDEPTQGVDVGARAEIYDQIIAAAGNGSGVLLVSSDLDELLHLADRVLVIKSGAIVSSAAGDEVTRPWIMHAMFDSLEES
ncbi:sugar ABC transporter ATP-binding protein [Ornithinimicrobium faecis]|uniref:sugar ABC transporter ATP-binding protein n=1 Tax=Ornithinimicrobium faecis TaxID=2934158 RepID=UPI002117E270|nr:sugar ABC transporter ATP-binding protein [Ornithinimicrobium sp. HY1745]